MGASVVRSISLISRGLRCSHLTEFSHFHNNLSMIKGVAHIDYDIQAIGDKDMYLILLNRSGV